MRLLLAGLLWRLRLFDLAESVEATVLIQRKLGPPRTVERLRQRVLNDNWDRPLDNCPGCGGPADRNWFDRSLCPCQDGPDWGVMHTRCEGCGYALDGCEFESVGRRVMPITRTTRERKLEAVAAAALEARKTGYSSIALLLALNQALDQLRSA